jgi:3-hydroxyisobutyrate dehydrogenase-like beta-hydroxyacid dehydrogenase
MSPQTDSRPEVDGRDDPACVAVLGLGEAGMAIALDLCAAGARVRAFDPAVASPPGTVACRDEADAAAGADLVLSVNSAQAAVDALRSGLSSTSVGAVWADLNTSAPALKRQLAALCQPVGVAFVDVALMSPVPGNGLATPALACGPGAAGYAALVNRLGGAVEVLDGQPGLAATRKLLRSVFYKGLTAAVIEALTAARAAGCEEWLRENISAELTAANARTLERLEMGTYRHAARRVGEMSAASELLAELSVPARISTATRDWLRQIAD